MFQIDLLRPLHAKSDQNDTANNCPVDIMPSLSKIYDQIFTNFPMGLSQKLQYILCKLSRQKKTKSILDNGGAFGAFPTDLDRP